VSSTEGPFDVYSDRLTMVAAQLSAFSSQVQLHRETQSSTEQTWT
jgi:hypothetical protein